LVSPVVVTTGSKAAKDAAHTISEALTADLAVVRFEGKKRKGKKPVEYELHLNPAAFGVAVVGAGLAMWLLQLRVGLISGEWGVWRWSDGSNASKAMWVTEKGDTPYKKPTTEPPVRPEGMNPAEQALYLLQYANWLKSGEYATWVVLDAAKPGAVIKERKGFLGSGIGTDTSDAWIKALVPGLWFL